MQAITSQEFMLALGHYFAEAGQHGLVIVLPEGQLLQISPVQVRDLPPETAHKVNQLQQIDTNSFLSNYTLLGNEDDSFPDELSLMQLGLGEYASLLNSDSEM